MLCLILLWSLWTRKWSNNRKEWGWKWLREISLSTFQGQTIVILPQLESKMGDNTHHLKSVTRHCQLMPFTIHFNETSTSHLQINYTFSSFSFLTYLEILNKSFLIFVIIATVSTGFALLSILFCRDDCSFAHDSVFQTKKRKRKKER